MHITVMQTLAKQQMPLHATKTLINTSATPNATPTNKQCFSSLTKLNEYI